MSTIRDIVIYFFIFSFAGWVCETIFCTVTEKKLAYRGFLNGPICPIYGFGGLIVVYILAPFKDNIFILFLLGMLCTTILEYITSYILEKLFNVRWWDYSHFPFNINGRVCLAFSLIFGGLSVVAVYFIYPPFESLVMSFSGLFKYILAVLMLAVFIADCAVIIGTLLKFNGTLSALEKNRAEIDEFFNTISLKNKTISSEERIIIVKEGIDKMDALLESTYSNLSSEDKEMVEKLSDKEKRFQLIGGLTKTQLKRLELAFPQMLRKKYSEVYTDITEKLGKKK